ncbi:MULTISPECIES: ScyD/ScyE family protein [Okeania]|nr:MULTISPECIES: ScyD/ScyE family protein [Okeania]NET12392.1 ScyD/ScyE family protein [Okeania sp. SIO1H6]NES79688.1 ScyD/ScyE family protein [Okeania sp. SIO1H4]NES91491.1 ScyD/ScyE family protein [Okeania sp. SIO2B9]NET23367.1 ScyD/ScyE family protein [Okeania sp. SIO1H5]NET75033.1 ScyD/ScyE family protein [Okeania sp. SIO1F9]
MLKKISITAATSLFVMLGFPEAAQSITFTSSIFASGLDNPSGLAFGPDDALYVTEAGKGGPGPCVPSPSVQGAEICYGPTSAITRIKDGVQEQVITGLPSLALPDGSEANGANDIAFDSNGLGYVVVGFATNPANRDPIVGVPDFGSLISLDFNQGTWTKLSDLSNYELLNNPDQTDIISNPYSLLIEDNIAFIIDAGANDLLSVDLSENETALEAVFEEIIAINPFSGLEIPVQSVPTSITNGPDGAFYVGELTGFPFPDDGARIFRVVPGNEPEVYLEGFTQIIDLAFDNQGNLYVLEYAAQSLLTGNPVGALIQISSDGTRRNIGGDQLILPTAITVGADNAIYVANNGPFSELGEIIRFKSTNEATPVPESSSILGLLIFGINIALFRYSRRSKINRKPLQT